MVVIITMKNVIKRDGTYYFRIIVPKDCQESVGKTEITQSLKTKDDVKAAVAATDLNRKWKKKFDSLRIANPSIPVTMSGPNETVSDFRDALNAHMDQHLPDFLDRQSEAELLMLSREYLVRDIAYKKIPTSVLTLPTVIFTINAFPKVYPIADFRL